MVSQVLQERATTLLALHVPGNPVVLPTVWDAWSARLAVDAPQRATGRRLQAWPAQPETDFLATAWDQALQEIWAGGDAKQALDNAKNNVDAHMKDLGLITG